MVLKNRSKAFSFWNIQPGLFEETHRDLKGKRLALEATNSNEPGAET